MQQDKHRPIVTLCGSTIGDWGSRNVSVDYSALAKMGAVAWLAAALLVWIARKA
jgi:hypothetical protein